MIVAYSHALSLLCDRSRTFRHGVRLGRSFYHVMASTTGELRITDSRSMTTTVATCPEGEGEEAASDLRVVTKCVRETMQLQTAEAQALLSQDVCATPLVLADDPTSSNTRTGAEPGVRGLAFLHFVGPTVVLFDQKSGRVFVAGGGKRGSGGVLPDRKTVARDPRAVLQTLWRDRFAAADAAANNAGHGHADIDGTSAPTILGNGVIGVTSSTDSAAVVLHVNATQRRRQRQRQRQRHGSGGSSSSSSSDSSDDDDSDDSDGKSSSRRLLLSYVIETRGGASDADNGGGGGPPGHHVQTNNFTGGSSSTPSPRASVLLPRVIRTAHRFRSTGCRVMVEINHRVDPVKVVVFEQRSMTSQAFFLARDQFDLPQVGWFS